ncbi:YHYH domain-containing protein [Alcaligenaceae bacterium CGII-47]|nr:YHYH domain-containing protein [Alcaligenaceae bacterium CGII-47]
MKNIFIAIVLVMFGAAVTIPDASAHSGRTDRNGCHNDNKNGGLHCH